MWLGMLELLSHLPLNLSSAGDFCGIHKLMHQG